MLFPVIILYVIVFISTSFADVRLVRVKRSVKPNAELDLNSLDFNSPEWVRKHLKNKIIQKDAITFELGTPQYEILNPEDQPEIITHNHPYYYENLKLYGQHDDHVQQDATKNDDHKQNKYKQLSTKVNSMENSSTNSAETKNSDESATDESEDSEEEQFKFVFVKAKSKSEKTTKPTAKQDKESEDYKQSKEQHKTKVTKSMSSDVNQNQSQQQNLPLRSESSTYDNYKEQLEEPHVAASISSYPQYAYPSYNHYIPGTVYAQSTPYINPFYYYNNYYNYGSEQSPYMSEFDQLYRAALEPQEQYNRKLSIYPQLYAPKKYYYF